MLSLKFIILSCYFSVKNKFLNNNKLNWMIYKLTFYYCKPLTYRNSFPGLKILITEYRLKYLKSCLNSFLLDIIFITFIKEYSDYWKPIFLVNLNSY